MRVLLKADEDVKRTREITSERNRLSKEFGQVRLEVYNWEENWRMVKMCQRFLYQVSPVSWRTEHDWIHRSDSGENVASASTEDLFGRYRMTDDVESLDTLIGDRVTASSVFFLSGFDTLIQNRLCGGFRSYLHIFRTIRARYCRGRPNGDVL